MCVNLFTYFDDVAEASMLQLLNATQFFASIFTISMITYSSYVGPARNRCYFATTLDRSFFSYLAPQSS